MLFLMFVQSLFQFGAKVEKWEGYYGEKNYLDISFLKIDNLTSSSSFRYRSRSEIELPLSFVQYGWNLAQGSILTRWLRMWTKKADRDTFWARKRQIFLQKAANFAQALLHKKVAMATS